jgi:ATP-dependent Clp protease ATP-binding subunit ClpX
MRDSIGFGREQAAGASDPDAIAVDFTSDQVENVANFQAYGFLPELVARFTRVVPFKSLDAQTLKDILRSDVITRMTREFKLEGFGLDIDEDVLDHVVSDALRRETGARGLASTLTRQLEDVAFGAFGVSEGASGDVRVVMRGGDIAVDIV